MNTTEFVGTTGTHGSGGVFDAFGICLASGCVAGLMSGLPVLEGSDEGSSASPAGSAGEAKELPPGEVEVESEAAEGWHSQASRAHRVA